MRTRDPSPSVISAPAALSMPSMSRQRILARTGSSKTASSVGRCFRFMLPLIVSYYDITVNTHYLLLRLSSTVSAFLWFGLDRDSSAQCRGPLHAVSLSPRLLTGGAKPYTSRSRLRQLSWEEHHGQSTDRGPQIRAEHLVRQHSPGAHHFGAASTNGRKRRPPRRHLQSGHLRESPQRQHRLRPGHAKPRQTRRRHLDRDLRAPRWRRYPDGRRCPLPGLPAHRRPRRLCQL